MDIRSDPGGDSPLRDPADAGADEVRFWGLGDADLIEDFARDWGMGADAFEDDMGESCGGGQEFVDALFGHPSKFKEEEEGGYAEKSRIIKRAKPKSQHLIDEYDFVEGPERTAFIYLRDAIKAACSKKTDPAVRQSAMDWIMSPDINGISFNICCQALAARPDVVRMRMYYQFYDDWSVFQAPILPFLSSGLPEQLNNEILFFLGDEALAVAHELWKWPSMQMDDLVNQMTKIGMAKGVYGGELQRAMESAEERGYIANHMDYWYLTGRNPRNRQRGDTVNWSGLWL